MPRIRLVQQNAEVEEVDDINMENSFSALYNFKKATLDLRLEHMAILLEKCGELKAKKCSSENVIGRKGHLPCGEERCS